ncbi:amino acid adenylation domain-containing protein, partial [Steroidobacter flavus]
MNDHALDHSDAIDGPHSEASLPSESTGLLSIQELSREQWGAIARVVSDGPDNIQDIYPLSPLQEGILFHRLLNEACDTYVLSTLFEVRSRADAELLAEALQSAIDRHESLRSAVLWKDLPRPVQVVCKRARLPIEELTLKGGFDSREQLNELMRPGRPAFELGAAPLVRLLLVQPSDATRGFALLQVHHLICDHQSLRMLVDEAMMTASGRSWQLPPAMTYRQLFAEAGTDEAAAEEFFRKKLAGVDESTAPFGLIDIHGDGSGIDEASATLDVELDRRIREQARRAGVTVGRFFHAAWSLVVARTSGRDDIVFGTVLSSLRRQSADERVLGMFVNTLPLRLQLQGMTAQQLVRTMADELGELLNHRRAPLPLAQRCSEIGGTAPLFTCILNFRHTARDADAPPSETAGIRVLARGEAWTNYPIAMTIDDLGDGFTLTAQVDRRIGPDRIMGMLQIALGSLVDALEHAPETQASSLSILTDLERDRTLRAFNATRAIYPRNKRVHQLFEDQVRRTPEAVALVYEQASLTYRELNRQANRLANYLRRHNVEAADYVPLVMGRSPQLIVAQLAVLKCGGVYVPIDPEQPAERRAFMIRDCGARVVLTDAANSAALSGQPMHWIDCSSLPLQDESAENVETETGSVAAAYVMYTSGSTGAPKGVIVPHHAVNRLAINNGYARIDADDCIAHYSNPSFDASTFEVWCALLNGARVAVVPHSVVLEADQFAELLERQRVTQLYMSVGLFNQYADALTDVFARLRYLMVGGDALDPRTVRRVLKAAAPTRFLNVYGPTECTTFSTAHLVESVDEGATSIPIGRPISNAQIYILDRHREPVPIGAIGEIYIGGDGVALGYLNRDDLTAERFVRDPFSADPSAHLYKSGDLGRWREDGCIEYLGRDDHQVKIRGFRIELEEIETQLARHEQVKDVVVIAREDRPGNKRLIAYVVPREPEAAEAGLTAEALRLHLKTLLPEYMVPSAFMILKTFPLTSNGKIDRRALPAPDAGAYASREYEAPRSETERTVARLWQELLQVAQVGRDDDFFELGGHSLLAMQVSSRLRQTMAVEPPIRLLFKCPVLKDLCEQIDGLRSNRAAAESIPVYRRRDGLNAEVMPTCGAQQRLWFIDRLEAGSAAYHVPVAVRLRGDLDCAALQVALNAVIARHEALRTTFIELEGEPVQRIARESSCILDITVLSADSEQEREGLVLQHSREELLQLFDLSSGPLIRGRLLQLARDEHVLLITMHHIISDGWSVEVLLRELAALYAASRRGVAHSLPDLPIQYGDYALWQRQSIATLPPEQLEYWREHLRGAPEMLELPTDRPRPATQSYRGATAKVQLGEELTARVKALSRQYNLTLAMTLYTAWTVVLARLSGQEDVVVGLPVANRGRVEVEGLIGFFVNTLAVRVSLPDDPTVSALLHRVKETMLGAYAHQDVPFERVVEALQPSRRLSHSPIFQAMFVLQSAARSVMELPGLTMVEQEVPLHTAQFDLLLSLQDGPEGIKGTLNYATDLFDESTIRRWVGYFKSVLESMTRLPELPISRLPLMGENERHQVLRQFNATQADYPKASLVHELFEDQVHRTPDAVAVVFEERSLSYRQLNAKANQLAHYLRARGIGPDRLVGICVERSLEMVVGLLGILKAGGAYVPLDPAYPAERLEYMLQDAAPGLLLTQERLQQLPVVDVPTLRLDADWAQIDTQPVENIPVMNRESAPRRLAYVIYTSGSTGRPKGAMNEHRAVINRVQWMQSAYRLGPSDAVLQKTPFSFDVSVWEFFWTLMSGAHLVVARPQGHQDPEYLRRLIQQSGVTTVHFVPSMLQIFLDQYRLGDCPSLRHIVCSGEELPASLQKKVHECLPEVQLSNLYGPTEAAVDVTAWECSPDAVGTRVPIGRPIGNIQMYVLDRHLQPVPVGVNGEIYIGGVGVGRGYLNRAELTAQRFVADPYSTDPTARLYKTGDVGRWRADGAIEYLGRNDHQVKIRGFRIELGEIEGQLLQHEHVREAVVLAREDVPGDKRLVAYVTGRDGCSPSVDALRTHLKTALPEYMVPSAFVLLAQFPLSPNGKLERRALPAPDLRAYSSREYQAPQGEVEEVLAGIWQSLLHVDRVGRRDNFFELGGHSLLIVQMIERLRRVGLSAELRRVFDSASLADLAKVLRTDAVVQFEVPANLIPEECETIVPEMLPLVELTTQHIERIVNGVPGGAANVQDIYPLAPLQEGILFHHLLSAQGADTYVLPTLLSISSRERLAELIAVLQATIDRHDVLRTAVIWDGVPQPVQVIYRTAILPVEEIDLDPEREALAQVEEWIAPDRQKLDLRQAPLLRLRIASHPSGSLFALLQLHHMTIDHVTLEALTAEIVARLEKVTEQPLPAVPYRNHVAQALAYARTREAERFFSEKLGHITEATAPFDLLDVRGDGSEIDEARQEFEPELARRVRAQARRLSVSAATLFHAGWGLVVARTAGRDEVVFGSVLLGRMQSHASTQRMLGMFINTLPLRLQLHGTTARSLVEQTQRELIELLAHEQASLAVAQRQSGIVGSAPLFTALFNYRHSVPDREAAWSNATGIRALAVQDRTNYPVTVSVDDLGEEFALTAQTHRRVNPRRVLSYLQTAVRSLVTALEQAPQTPTAQLSILPDEERRQVMELFNPHRSFSSDQLINELFEAQVRRAPHATAVTYNAHALTYADLNGRANRLAHYLCAHRVGPDQLVAICVDRSVEMVVGLLGILKSGAAYVPMDPTYPRERLQHILEDAAPRVVLTQAKHRDIFQGHPATIIALDDDWSDVSSYPATDPDRQTTGLQPHHLAYVIYTSGSTGKPKGVMVEHRNVTRLFTATEHWFQFGERDVWTLFHSFAFDFSVWELWGALFYGGRLAIVPYLTARSADDFYRLLCEEGVTVLNQTPSAFVQLIDAQARNAQLKHSLRVVIFGGEALELRSLRPWIERNGAERPHLVNMYGITETTVHVTYRDPLTIEQIFSARDNAIGQPIPDLRVYILDPDRQPVPIGVAGEMYVGGAGVARGYLNRAELTAERFILDPFRGERLAVEFTERLYKSGDLGRWRPDGSIEYLGRNDHQVKIRGFRIELGEIEAQLARHTQVKDAIVLAREDVPGEKRLVAYIVPSTEEGAIAPSPEQLRTHLREMLPEYMVPSAFVVLERLPLTSSGKLDRRALPAPELTAYTKRQYEAPQGPVETALAGIWQELLRVERVGRQDNFFELGGHSLLIVQMMERLRRVGLATDVRRVFDSPALTDLARVVRTEAREELAIPPNAIPEGCVDITPEMLPLVELSRDDIVRIARALPGGFANLQDIYPLAPLQEGILFHHLLSAQGGDIYLRPTLWSFASPEKLQQFIEALQRVIDRHDILRTAILWEQLPRAVQVVQRKVRLPVESLVLDANRDPIEQLQEMMTPAGLKLDLRTAPLMRLYVAQPEPANVCYAILQSHHITCDNQSLGAMFAEVAACLRGAADGLGEPVPYRNHVAQALARAQTNDAEAFFRQKLADVEEPTAPFGVLEVRESGQLSNVRQRLEPKLASRIRLQGRRLNVSAATLFHAAWGVVVSRTSGRDDVVFGTVLLGRLQGTAGAQRTLGMFINTLPLRLRLTAVTAAALVDLTQQELIGLLDHEQAPLAVAQRCSGIDSSAPLFSSLMNYVHSAVDVRSELIDTGVSLLGTEGGTNYPLALTVEDQGDAFFLELKSASSIDPTRALGHMRAALESLVQALESAPHTPALELEVLPAAEREQVIASFNASERRVARNELVHELFEKQVARTPGATAIVYEGKSLTYSQLNAAANRLAHLLRANGVGPDRCVAFCLDRSLDLVVALLGILKAGGAYVPLDPVHPRDRLSHMLRDSEAVAILTQTHLRDRFEVPGACLAVVMNDVSYEQMATAVGASSENPDSRTVGLTPSHLAYVIYTSGSTGQPKGVMVEHGNVLYFLRGMEECIHGIAPDCRRIAWNSSVGFDMAVKAWGQLTQGRSVYLLSEATRFNGEQLLAYIEEHRIEAMECTPSHLRMLREGGFMQGRASSLRKLLIGGEPIDVAAWRELAAASDVSFFNMYGPTECTVDATIGRIAAETPNIGRAMPESRIYILDRQKQPMPIGVTGEIYIGGAGVARGYLNREALTAERFVRDPFSADAQARMYKTGDLGRWRSDGTIEYLGRNDDQVKIRGYRIELGEIEAQLLEQPHVKEAAVIAREDTPGEKRLVAYYTVDEAVDLETLRTHLKGSLPEYMVPSAFVALERWPLTPNGKLDRRALPAPDVGAYTTRQYEAPQGEVEEILVGIWQSLLQVERVGRQDNFFELGGHSLLIMQMMERLRRVGLSTNVRQVFETPVISDLGGAIRAGAEEEWIVPANGIPHDCVAITPAMLPLVALSVEHLDRIGQSVGGGSANIKDIYPLGPLQEGILFHHLMNEEGGDPYVVPTVLSVASRERLDALIEALQGVIDRHDILRTAVLWERLPRPVQVVYRHAQLPVDEMVLDPIRALDEQLREWLQPERQRMDLRQAPLLRLQVARDPRSERWFALLQLHHIISDNTSQGIVISEIIAHLEGRAQLLPPSVPYRNHVAQTLAYARRHDADAFFREKLSTVEEPTAPFGLLDVYGDGTQIRQAQQVLERTLAARARDQARRLGVSAATLFHAAWGLVVAHTSGRDDVVFGTVLLGRLQGSAGAEQILGLFINTLPLRLQLDQVSAKELVERTQRELVGLLGHEQASLTVAKRASAVSGSTPLFSALLNFRHGLQRARGGWSSAEGIEVLAGRTGTNYPITLSVDDLGIEGFRLTAQTDRRIDPQRLTDYLHTALQSLVEALERSPQTLALTLPMLPTIERRQLLEEFNATALPYPQAQLIHELFEAQVSRTPTALAVMYETQSLTYEQLNGRANQLARYLRARGVGPDRRVGICIERSLEMVIGVLGTLKAGGAYVPLDPNYPAERLRYMIEDAAP